MQVPLPSLSVFSFLSLLFFEGLLGEVGRLGLGGQIKPLPFLLRSPEQGRRAGSLADSLRSCQGHS